MISLPPLAPVVAGHVGPLQDALLAHQVQGQPEIRFDSKYKVDPTQILVLARMKTKAILTN